MADFSQYVALVGLDWADRKHDICLHDAGEESAEYSVIENTPEAIDHWVRELQTRFQGKPVAIALEQKRGPVLYALAKYDFVHLVPINPQTLARLRRAFTPSRAKDDPTDAALMIDMMRRHGDKLEMWNAESNAMRELRLLVQMRRYAVQDRVRISNRLTACLKQYYPQPLHWFKDHDTQVFAHFIQKWPELKKAQSARGQTQRQFFYDHNIRYGQVIENRLVQIKASLALTDDRAIIDSYQRQAQSLCRQLLCAIDDIKQYEQAIKDCLDRQELVDVELFQTLPGAGEHLSARLLAAFGSDRNAWSDANSFLQYSGVAPVTERSGKKEWVHYRYSCNKFLRQTFIEWAAQTTKQSYWAKQYYEQQKEKGKPRQVILRALAYKWIRIVHRCWLNRERYDEAKYLLALEAKNSPLLQGMKTS